VKRNGSHVFGVEKSGFDRPEQENKKEALSLNIRGFGMSKECATTG